MNETVDWLMAGDPAIRWQTLRDIEGAPERTWGAERRQVTSAGWGARLLSLQDAEGTWGGGVYSPKWTSTTFTLLTLCRLGVPADCESARQGALVALQELLGARCDDSFRNKLAKCDRCIVGMLLRIAAYFRVDDARVDAIVDNLLGELMADGGWNCRRDRKPRPHHSSFHTTFNALEGLRTYLERKGTKQTRRTKAIVAAEQGALEFMLQHRLFKSHRTGAIVNPRFMKFALPFRWQYDVLRGLDYFAQAGAERDPRLEDAIALLGESRGADGLWTVGQQYTGKVFFHLERLGAPSRWNTLRALRVLRWWECPRPAGRASKSKNR
jgi:hypothetical protein